MNNVLEKIAFLAPRGEHNQFAVRLAVLVVVLLQFDWRSRDTEYVGNSAVSEERTEHTISLTGVEVSLVD